MIVPTQTLQITMIASIQIRRDAIGTPERENQVILINVPIVRLAVLRDNAMSKLATLGGVL
jgi:hypothetical protein